MGEIGIPRRDFLYDLRYWETLRIIRGYRRRDWLKLQMMAQCSYAAMFAMRDPMGKTVKDFFPFLFEDDDESEPPDITEEDVAMLQEEMNAWGWGNPPTETPTEPPANTPESTDT